MDSQAPVDHSHISWLGSPVLALEALCQRYFCYSSLPHFILFFIIHLLFLPKNRQLLKLQNL